ncbi:MAG: aminotransferase class I/II-fold pyridoxal phosphate-dependent enzyme [Gammaproteobacteria bacterium]|nr:aminotransferase class I/II-fold pyridoxal phosphate-dependent enzyme [Gammaproteobacteria bacterium]
MREAIAKLEAVSRQLEPPPDIRREITEQVVRYADRFLDALPEMPVYVPGQPDTAFGDFIGDAPVDLELLLAELAREVDTPGINPASGAHLGYIPGGGVYYAALGDYLADVSNRYSGIYFASPGAVQLEQRLVQWLARLIGYGTGAGGDLTSGGSIANLSAIVAAREAHGIAARDIPDTCVYLTSQVHHCVTKALGIAGLKECIQRVIPMDQSFRMDVAALQKAITDDRKAGLKPWMVVASAGTTDTGSVDPLDLIASVAAEQGLWLHVDGAYGGAFLLCDAGQSVLSGIEKADSVVIDPHKGFFLPYGSGAVIVKNRDTLAAAHGYHADYMQDAVEDDPSPASLSAELTRPFRGLRLWLPLKLAGLKPFRAALDEKLLLAQYFREQLAKLPDFEVGPVPELSVVIYRYKPPNGADTEDFNRRLVDAIQRDGQIFISSTRIEGRYMLRLAVLNFRTHLEHIDRLLALLPKVAGQLAT